VPLCVSLPCTHMRWGSPLCRVAARSPPPKHSLPADAPPAAALLAPAGTPAAPPPLPCRPPCSAARPPPETPPR
jgi:hypothetical protein